MRTTYTAPSLRILALLILGVAVGCTAGVGAGGAFIAFEIGGQVFSFSFGNLGVGRIRTEAGKTTQATTARTSLFDHVPTDRPPTGAVRLPSSNVGIFQPVTGKGIVRSQALPLTGTATFTIKIAPGSSTDPCADGVVLASYDIVFTTGIAAVVDEVAEISAGALEIVLTNDVTICLEVTADFDGEFEIGEIFISFGTDSDPTPPDPPGFEEPPPPATGDTIQVPIDNMDGAAVVAPVTTTIDGVDYGVVGVLDVTTPDAPASVDPGEVSVNLDSLGLASVDTLHISTHSAWVPDLPDGVTLATLTCSYAEGGTPTTLDLVLGENTSEWSYDRPEHVTFLGGVQHAMAPELYSFETTIDSTSEYTGYVYSVTLPSDSTRTLACLSLTAADVSTYIALRPSDAPVPTWAGQAMTAITLEGPAGTPSLIGDCSGATTPVDGDGTVTCDDTADCGPDEVCLDGLCMPLPAGCTDDTDCPSGEVCTDGECVPEAVPEYTLTIAIEGMGSVDPAGGTYDPGTPVTLIATAEDGWRFERWEGDVTGSDNPVMVTLNADTTITAVFVEVGTSAITFRATYDRLWDTDEQNPGYAILHSVMSGDGNRLVWAIQDNDTGALSILTMNVDGSDQTIIPAPAEADSIWEVTINYDGSRAFFRRWFNLLFKVEGGVITQILDVADVDGLGSIGSIQCTTTGDYVYFLDDEPDDNDIWRCSHAGGTAELVVNDTEVILHNGFPASQVADFSVSGDGGSLVFTTYAYWGDGGYASRSEMFVQTGGAYTQLTTDGSDYTKTNPRISGDGSIIVFSRNYSWYSMNPDGTNEIELGPAGHNLGGPELVYDGSKMFYSDTASGGTVLLNTDGSGRQNIVPAWNITNIAIGATNHHAISDDTTRVSFYTQYGILPENAAFYVGYLEGPDIIASSVSGAPFIDSITFSPEAFPSSDPEATLLLLASIGDPDGLADVTNAAVDAMIDGIHSSYADVPAYFYHSPRDDGESPDEIAADGVFTSAASAGEMLDTLDAVTIRVSAMDASKTVTVADTVLTITGSD